MDGTLIIFWAFAGLAVGSALAYLTVIATAIWFLHDRLGWPYDTRFALALFGLNLLLAVLLFFVLDRGHIIAGSVAAEEGAGGV